MPNEPTERGSTSSMLSTVSRLLDESISGGQSFDNLITVLSLVCIISIFNRGQSSSFTAQPREPAGGANIGKLLGDLMKSAGEGGGAQDGGGGGLGPETLMALLPLLNNPQLKSKLNPATISSVLGMLNNLGGGASGEKPEKESSKERERAKEKSKDKESEPPKEPAPREEDPAAPDPYTEGGKSQGRFLNWKTNF